MTLRLASNLTWLVEQLIKNQSTNFKGFTEQQMELVSANDRVIEERSKEIQDVVKSIHQLAEIFRELQTMVIDQGTLLDRIDYNIEQVSGSMKAAHEELSQVHSP